MPVVRSNALNQIEQTFGDYTCQWPSDLESSLLTYVETHGVFHLIQVGRRNDATTIIVSMPFLSVFSRRWPTVVEPLKAIRFLGVESIRQKLSAEISKMAQASNPTTEQAESVLHLAKFFRWAGWYNLGEDCARFAVDVFRQQLGPQHEVTLDSQNVLLALLVHNGRAAIAESLGQYVLSIYQQLFGVGDARTLKTMVLMGDIYREMNHKQQAVQILQKALGTVTLHFPVDYPLKGVILGKLAGIYKKGRQFDVAEQWALRDVTFKVRALGKHHPLTMTAHNQLADIYCCQERFAEAEKVYQYVLNHRLDTLGQHHPAVAVTCGGLSRLMKAQQRIGEAIRWRLWDVRICTHNLGGKHAKTQMAQLYLAELYVLANDHLKAENVYHSVFRIQQETLGLDHWKTRKTIRDLLGVLKKQRRHRDVLMLRMKLSKERAILFRSLGKLEREASELRALLNLRQYVYGFNHEKTLQVQNNLAWVLLDLEQEEALMYFQHLQNAWMDPQDWKSLWVTLGASLMTAMMTGDFTQCVACIDGLEQLLGEEHERVLKAKERMRRFQSRPPST